MEIVVLNLTPEGVTPNTHASQFDDGRVIRFALKDGASAYTLAGTETITAKITRSDLTQTTLAITNTSDNYIDLVTDADTCPVSGVYACEIEIVDGGVVIGSQNYALLVQRDPYDGKNIRIVTVGPADICTFSTNLPEPYQSVLVNVEATGGNGTPDNPIPIVGYTEANITRCGVNLWQYGNQADTRKKEISGVDTIKTGSYTFSANITTEATSTPRAIFYYPDGTGASISTPAGTRTSAAITLTQEPSIIEFWAGASAGDSNGKAFSFTDIQLELGNMASDYHAYNGQTYTIAFGDTYYGGVLDVTRGKLHVTHIDYDMGNLNWFTSLLSGGTVGFGFDATAIKMPPTNNDIVNALCEVYKVDTIGNVYAKTTDKIFGCYSNITRVVVYDSDYSDVPTFKASVTGKKLVYELATPFDIDLTPVQISALVGENNVFADCGETTVEYLDEG